MNTETFCFDCDLKDFDFELELVPKTGEELDFLNAEAVYTSPEAQTFSRDKRKSMASCPQFLSEECSSGSQK